MSKKHCILALDQGTTSSRAMVFNQHGEVLTLAQREFAQYFPQSGWVEHNAEEIWRAQQAVAQECLHRLQASHGLGAADMAAIGITNQRETTVLWDRATGQALAPAIVWQDRRTAAYCDELRAQGRAAEIQQKTGLVLDAYFSATKLRWLLDNTPGAHQRARNGELAFGTIDSWLVWKLTAGQSHITDVSNAARTLLMNIHTLEWDDDLLALFGIPRALLPRIVPCSGALAETSAELFGVALPITGMAGDQQAATFGQACFDPGMAKNTYGTGCFMLMNTGQAPVASQNQLLSTVAWRLQEQSGLGAVNYALEGSVFMAGATVQWLRDGLGLIETAADIEALAAGVPDTDDVFLVPAFTGLGAPYWDARARGSFCGLNRGTTRAHIARAVLEAIALQSADVFAAMSRDASLPLSELRVDGGASRNNLLMQMQADFSGVPVVRPQNTETTALGAAYLAGLAAGVWRNQEEISAQWAVQQRFEPSWGDNRREQHLARWHQAVERAKGWAQD